MAATARGRGLGITKNDMDASRLVFVYVRDAKPRRKVAVPVPDSYTWEQFLNQVQTKLKLTGIGDIYLSSSGHKVRNVNELQDIDELCVVEAPATTIHANGTAVGTAFAADAVQRQTAELQPRGSGGPDVMGVNSPLGTTSSLRQHQVAERHKVAIADGAASTSGASYMGGDDDEGKYARRAHPLRRSLQRVFPGLFAPGLPVTMREAQADSGDGGGSGMLRARRRKGRRNPYTVQNLLVVLVAMSCIGTMIFYFFKLQPAQLAGTGSAPVITGHATQRLAGDAAATSST